MTVTEAKTDVSLPTPTLTVQRILNPIELNRLKQNPEILIPPLLSTLVKNPSKLQTIPFETWLGRADDEYQPFAVLITEKDGLQRPSVTKQEVEDGGNDRGFYDWGQVINHYRQLTVESGLVSPCDKALILLMAQESYPFGIHIIDYLEIASLRKQGLGTAFYNHFGKVVKEMGYQYRWGEHNSNNIRFFVEKLGDYTLDQLRPESFNPHGLSIPLMYVNKLNSINFFNRQIEEAFVKPEHLKINVN